MEVKEAKINQIRQHLDQIIAQMDARSKEGMRIHQVERSLFTSLLQLGFQLLEYYILSIQQVVAVQGVPVDRAGEKMKNTGLRSRPYRSIFGPLSIARPKYYSTTGKSYYRLDEALGLPKSNYSYVLDDWLGYGATEMDFAQSAEQLERILGHPLRGMQSQRCSYRLCEQVKDFYEQQAWENIEDGTHLSVGFDGKGVPIRRSETQRAEESTAVRLSKGQKKGVKKEATVSLSSSFTPRPRQAQELLESLFCPTHEPQKPDGGHTWHEHKHLRAFLSDKVGAIRYGVENLLRRDASAKKPIIVLIDGDRALEKAVRQVVEEKKVTHRVEAYVLDFIHLLEYVWKVANAHWGEKHPNRFAWVRSQAALLLDSQHDEVRQQWQVILQQATLSQYKRDTVQRAITYLTNHQHMVDYKTYLQLGFPITTGAVESACGHFVKSRMERNGMHWGKQGAQNMLNLRAVRKNGDWDNYLQTVVKHEQQALYQKAA
ncbi:ISKra4 family transposase [Tunicatimonas pelagia]|uniref:ISKra4 family transposase n=1 Tax=Tunicatimonas pelagia TaxID=931531 RepID=UPI002664ECD6|nr:ISKra4 family transposase [Tunicatimonas pelagia]WKN41456.1 ISKra4 family transposase [Tunicatimonas pelagia]WKN42511.1 ISKra4 family transposase [Tunicatimonas pelagia]WKN43662.1 ISKra4 family transposase [Tunicatimonas pelagia]WKN44286.1 ISKra4 family transposase [Tunicatimonas pelagia]WKN44420.1 ISKra4 family transposase [Tunicatimonas pelagia]